MLEFPLWTDMGQLLKVVALAKEDDERAIKEALMKKHGRVAAALRAIDTKGDGSLSRDEIVAMLHQHRLIKHTDYYTGALHGDITMAQVISPPRNPPSLRPSSFPAPDPRTPLSPTRYDGAQADTLIDYVDDNRDGKINYQEFTKVLTADDIMHLKPPQSVNSSQLWGDGR